MAPFLKDHLCPEKKLTSLLKKKLTQIICHPRLKFLLQIHFVAKIQIYEEIVDKEFILQLFSLHILK